MLISADRKRQPALVSPHQLLKEAFRCGNVALRAQHKLDGVPGGVDGPVKVLSFFADFNVRLVEAVRRAAHLQVRAHPLIDLGRVLLDPPPDGLMIY